MFQNADRPIRLSAIPAGGSQAVFFKVNTLGEESFLDDVKAVSYTHLDVYKRQEPFQSRVWVSFSAAPALRIPCASGLPATCLLYTSRCV